MLPKTVTVCSEDACLRVKGTIVSLEIVKEGDLTTSIHKVYEGSFTFGRNMESKTYSKKTEEQAGQMKKLTEDYQSGKLNIEEFIKKKQELQKEKGAIKLLLFLCILSNNL